MSLVDVLLSKQSTFAYPLRLSASFCGGVAKTYVGSSRLPSADELSESSRDESNSERWLPCFQNPETQETCRRPSTMSAIPVEKRPRR